MAQRKPDLFQWNRRITQQPPNKQRTTKKDSIQEWMKRVQNASEEAVEEVLGYTSGGLTEALQGEIIPDDEAVYEAQQLVDGWMKESSLPHLRDELDYKHESWMSTTGVLHNDNYLKTDMNKNENNSMLDELTRKYLLEDQHSDSANRSYPVQETSDVLSGIGSEYVYPSSYLDEDDDIDDTLLVQDVLHGMLSKDFTKHVDLGLKPLEKVAKNPVPRMNLRHEEVKIRGEKRRARNTAKKKEKLTKEEIAQRAKERIVQEERQRIERENKEEKAILSEMEKIKQELAAEKQLREEENQRKKRILDEAKQQMQAELRRQKEAEEAKRKAKEEAKRLAQAELEEQAVLELKLKMKIMHKYFSAWYNVVLEGRVALGKANAVAHWKSKLRAWNAWRAYVACVRSDQHAREIEQAVKEKYRKEQMSVVHSNKTLLRKCFSSWSRYARYKADKKMLKLEHEEKARKMALFLEAASKGDLWRDKRDNNNNDDGANRNTEPMSFESKHSSLQTGRSGVKTLPMLDNPDAEIVDKGPPSLDSLGHTTELRQPGRVRVAASFGVKQKIERDKKTEELTDGNKVRVKHTACMNDHHVTAAKLNDKVESSPILPVHEQQRTINTNSQDTESAVHCSNEEILSSRSSVSVANTTASNTQPRIKSTKQTTKPLHLAMEERDKERRMRRAAIEEEKKKREEEKLEMLRAKEAERVERERLQKEEELRQRREEKKLEALKQKQKELQTQQFQANIQRAKEHYERVLLGKYGIKPLMKLVLDSRLNVEIADGHYQTLLQHSCLLEWHTYTQNLVDIQREKADACFERIILRRAFQSWTKCRYHMQNMNKIARAHSLRLIVKHAFAAWVEYVTDQRILTWAKESQAEEHDTQRMVKKYFGEWKSFVASEKEDRECEVRRNEWRKKVQSWLPDYKGGLPTE